MARLVKRAPAGEILAPQAMSDVALAEVVPQMLLVERDGTCGGQRLAIHELCSDDVRISPDGWATDIDRVFGHLPAFRAGTSDAFWFHRTYPLQTGLML